jgi:hypothetical protein
LLLIGKRDRDHEFAHRFCGPPHPSTLDKKVEKKASLMLQTPRKKNPRAGKAGAAIAELRGILEALYDGSSTHPSRTQAQVQSLLQRQNYPPRAR